MFGAIKFSITLLYFVNLSFQQGISSIFNSWMTKYGLSYSNPEETETVRTTFRNNYMVSSRQQLKYFNGQSKFLMKPNRFSHWTSAQRSIIRGFIPDSTLDTNIKNGQNSEVEGRTAIIYPTPPGSLDYRLLSYVTPVKDQGLHCSSCYAFSANCALEGQIAKKYRRLQSLSEQNIVDCSNNVTTSGNYGCYGGSMSTTYKYIKQKPGIANETNYPYQGVENKCAYNRTMLAENVTSYAFVMGDETYLKSALAFIGPLAIGVRADLDTFAFYSSGIYDDPFCDANINHAVCLVGYGTDETTSPPTDYWIIKNSWSTDWGEDGYMRMKMGSNLCGITGYVTYPKV